MANVVTCEQFLLLRASAESLKAAQSLQEIAASAKLLHDAVESSCDTALGLIDEQIRKAELTSLFLNYSNARFDKAMSEPDLAKMEAERDALLLLLKRECKHCDGFSPFSDIPCCEDRQEPQSK